MTDTLDRALAALPSHYPGPGGAVAVLRDGEVLVRHAWGFADAAQRVPFTPLSPFRICSITKQFVCALILDLCGDPSLLDAHIRAAMPLLQNPGPLARHLCHNQSGLRDYWALAMLLGPQPEDRFDPAAANSLIRRTASLQFAPGTRFSYANQNFRLLGDALAAQQDQDLATLLARLFRRAGMAHASLGADTAEDIGTVGYEGTQEEGFRPAVNRIVWTGDAGIVACLDDMIAWERFLDAGRDDPESLPNRLAAPVTFRDGRPASYGFGLSRSTVARTLVVGHGGGLRGWRSFRGYAPAERLSVIVLFNHMADAREAAFSLFGALLGETPRQHDGPAESGWQGNYIDPETDLAVRLSATADRRVRLLYGQMPELVVPDAGAANGGGTRLSRSPAGLQMERPGDNQSSVLTPCAGEAKRDIAGRYRCAEIEAVLTCVQTGDAFYGACSGSLGEGTMQMLTPLGADTWLMPCARALDHAPPGDWTLRVRRDADGRITGLRVGCWLARRLDFAYEAA